MKRLFTILFVSIIMLISAFTDSYAIAPTNQSRYLSFTARTDDGMNLSWISGNGSNRLIVVAYGGTANWSPVVVGNFESNYLASITDITTLVDAGGNLTTAEATPANVYTNGTTTYVVADIINGTIRTGALSFLTGNTAYQIHIYDYNLVGNVPTFNTTEPSNNPRTVTTLQSANPTTAPVLAAIPQWSNGTKITFTPGTDCDEHYLTVIDNTDNTNIISDLDIVSPFIITGLTPNRSYTYILRGYDVTTASYSPIASRTASTLTAPGFVITSYTPNAGVVKIGETVTLLLTATNLQEELQPVTISINGEDCISNFTDNFNGTYTIVYTVSPAGGTNADGVDMPLSITLKDLDDHPTANNLNPANSGDAPAIDATPAIVTSVTCTQGNGPHKIGTVLDFVITFSENVVFTAGTGKAQLLLETGPTNWPAEIGVNNVSSTTLPLTYTVTEGDVVTDLDYVDINSLTLTLDATLKDENGNDAILTLPAVGDVGSISDNQQIVFDAVRPYVVSIVKNTPVVQKTNATSTTWTVTFSENINAATLANTDFTLTSVNGALGAGPAVIAAPVEVTATSVYEVTANTLDGDAEIRLDFNASAVNDIIGNSSSTTAFETGETYIIDNTLPTAPITAPVADSRQKAITTISGTYEDAGTLNTGVNHVYVAVWNDIGTVDGTFDVGEDYYWNGTNFTTSHTVIWTEATLNSGAWSLPLAIPNGDGDYYVHTRVTDVAGNENVPNTTQGTNTYKFTIDNTAPTVTITLNIPVTLGSGYKTSDNDVSMDIAFSEPIVPADFTATDDITETLGGTSKTGSSLVPDGDDQNYTYNITGLTGDGTLTISIKNNGTSPIKDLAGNTISLATTAADNSFIIDNTPLDTISTGNISVATAGTEYYFDVTMNGGIYSADNTSGDFDQNNFTLAMNVGLYDAATSVDLISVQKNTDESATTINASVAGDAVYRVFFDVNGTANGSETMTLTPLLNNIYDDAGNASPVSAIVTKNLKDVTSPIVSVINDAGATYVKPGDFVTITFYVTEYGGITTNPTVSVLTSLSVAIPGGTMAFVSKDEQSFGTFLYTYTYTVPDVNESSVKIQVVATDDATLSHTLVLNNAFSIDNAVPSIVSVTPSHTLINKADDGETFNVVIVFSEPMKSSVTPTITFSNPAITAGLLTIGAGTWNTTTQFTQSYTIDSDILDTKENVDITIGAAQDLASNVIAGATLINADEFTVDTELPADFTVGTVVATGNTVVTGYLNSTNTGVDITVPIADDLTLVGGTIQLKASDNLFVGEQSLVAPYTILDADRIAGSYTFSVLDNDIEALTGYAEDDIWEFNAIITDKYGNPKTGTKSVNTLTIDQAVPTLSNVDIVSDNAVTTLARGGDNIILTFTSSEPTATPTLAYTSGAVAAANADLVSGGTTDWTSTYLTDATDTDGAVAFTIDFTDIHGNPGTQVVAANTGSVTLDNSLPAVPVQAMGAITSTGGTETPGYWNSTNTSITVEVNINNADATLDDGSMTLEMQKLVAGTWTPIANTASTITNGERVAGVKTITILDTDFETNSEFTEPATIQFRAVVTDKVGNSINWDNDGTNLVIDRTAPTAPVVTLNGGNIINGGNKAAVSLSFTHLGTTELDIAKYSFTVTDAGAVHTNSESNTDIAASPVIRSLDLSAFDDGVNTILASVTLKDVAGNVSAAGTDTESKNANAATVTNVTVMNDNGTYGIDSAGVTTDDIIVRVTFSKNINFTPGATGTLELELETGAAKRKAIGSTATTLFSQNYIDLTYLVQEDDISDIIDGLDYTNTLTTLDLYNGAAIIDEDLNPVTEFVLPAVGGASSIAGQKDIIIDGVKATFDIQYYFDSNLQTEVPDSKIFNASNNVYLGITSSKPLMQEPFISIDAQGTKNDTINATGFNFTGDQYYYHRVFVSEAGTDNSEWETITINAVDASGNPVTAVLSHTPAIANYITPTTTSVKLGRIDCTPPTFSVAYYSNIDYTTGLLPANSKLKAGTYYLKITSSEVLQTAPRLYIAAEGTANDKSNQATTWDAGLNAYKFVRVISTDGSAVGAVAETITLTGTDLAGNAVSLVAPTTHANNSIFTDTKAPTIAANIFTDPISTTLLKDGAGKSIAWTSASITDAGGLATANSILIEIEYTNGGGWNTIYQGDNTSPQTFTLNSGSANSPTAQMRITVTDAAGNISTQESNVFTIDNGAPTVNTLTNITSIGADQYAKTGETITVNFTPSENVSISSATIGGKTLIAVPNTGYNAAYTFTYLTDGTETEGLQALSIGVTDIAGNTATFTEADFTDGSLQIIYDKTVPAIAAGVFTSPVLDDIWNPVAHNITWDNTKITDALYSGLTPTPITLEYLDDVGAWVQIATELENNGLYSWSVPSISLENTQLRITAIDTAGNTAYQDSPLFNIDNAGPTVVLSNNISGRTEVKEGDIIRIIATFNDEAGTSIDDTPPPTITITNGQGVGSNLENTNMLQTSNTEWYYDWTIPEGNLTCAVTISAADIAGNASQVATGVTTYKVDNTAPSVVITNLIGTTCVSEANVEIVLTATFTDGTNTIDEVVPPRINITNGISNGVNISNIVMTKSTNKIWTYSWTIPTEALNLINAHVSIIASDLAGNSSTAATGDIDYTIDNVKPSVVLFTPATTYVNGAYAVTVTFSERIDDFLESDINISGDGTATISGFNNISPGPSPNTVWTFTVTPTGAGSIILDINQDIAMDCSGNTNTASNILTRTYDISIPAINTREIATNGNTVSGIKYAKVGNTMTLTLTATKPITTPTVTIGDETAIVTGVSPTTTYTATVLVDSDSPIADGAATINVSGYQDEAGNAGPVYTTLSAGTEVVVDRENPTILTVGTVQMGAIVANRYFTDISFTKLYTNADGTGAITITDFATPVITTNTDGAVTSAVITHATQQNNTNPSFATALVAGAENARVFYTANTAPTGNEEISISFNNSAVYDAAGNSAVNQSTGNILFPDKAAPLISNLLINGVNTGNVWVKPGATADISFQIIERSGLSVDPTVTVYTEANVGTDAVWTSTDGTGSTIDPYIYHYTYTAVNANSVMRVLVSATDMVNITGTGTLTNAFTVDNVLPTVLSIERIGADQYLNAGETEASFTVTFSEPVSGVAANNFAIETTVGSPVTGVVANPVGIAPTAIWTVETNTLVNSSGDASFKLNLNANLSGITDRANNAQTAPFTSGAEFIRDVTNPIVAIDEYTYPFTNGTQALTFVITETYEGLNEAMLSGGALTSFVSGSDVSSIDGWTEANGATTITVQHTDLAGNTGSDTYDVTKDISAPNLTSIVRTGGAAQYTEADDVSYTVNFDEEILGLDNANFILQDLSDAITGESITSTTGPAPATTWTVLANTGTIGDGALRLDLANNTNVTDKAGNALAQATFNTGETYILDRTAPIANVTIVPTTTVAITNGYIINKATTSITITANFDETMNTGTPPTIAFNPNFDAILNNESFTSSYWFDSDTYIWVIAVTDAGFTALDNTITITGAVNLSLVEMIQKDIINQKVDQGLPVASDITVAKGTYNKADNATNTTFSVTFNEEMNTASLPVFDYSGNNLSGVFGAVSNSAWTLVNTVYTATLPVTDNNTTSIYANTLRLTATTARDLAGNYAAQTSDDITFNVDMIAPTIGTRTIASSGNVGYAKLNDIITLSLTASESITQPTVNLAGSAATVSAGPNTAYTATLTVAAGTTEGTTAIEVNTYSDASGNPGAPYTSASLGSVIIDRTSPEVAITAPADLTTTNGTQLLTYTSTDLNAGITRARITNGSFAPFGSSTAISALDNFGTAVNENTFIVEVEQTDLAGNQTISTRSFIKDMSDPTATVSYNKTLLNRADLGANTFVVTVDYDEDMDQGSTPAISFLDPSPAAVLTVGTNAGWTTSRRYIAYYNVVDGSSVGNIDVSVAGARDLAQNTQNPYLETDVIDMVLIGPALTTVTIASNNNAGANPTWAKVGNTITINITGSTDLQNVEATINGNIATISNGGDGFATTWVATYIMQEADNNGPVTFTIDYEDLTSNPGDQVTETTNSSAVTFDKTLPVITITAPTVINTKVNNTPITYTVTEANSGATTATANGTTYLAFADGSNASTLGGFDGIGEGTFALIIRHIDIAGNIGQATINLVKDVTAPDLSSIVLNCTNSSATLNFNEAVYGNSNGTGQLSDAKFTASRTGSGKAMTSYYLSSIPAAGSSSALMTLVWSISGSFTGAEIVNVDVSNNTSIYDQAGNAMITGSPATYYTNIPITVASLRDTIACVNSNITIPATIEGGHSATYQWQKYNTGTSGWDNLTNTAPYANVTTKILSINNVPLNLSGAQYRVVTSNLCYFDANAVTSSAAILTVNPSTIITSQPIGTTICANGSAVLSTSATGTSPFTYTLKYEQSAGSWVDAADGVPAGAVYTDLGASSSTVSGLSAGTHNFKFSVLGACGTVESNTAAINVIVTPDADITAATSTTFCDGASVELTADEPEDVNITYQWKLDGSDIDLATNRTYVATLSGVYTVTINNSTTTCSATTASGITVSAAIAPLTTITASGATTICSGASVLLTADEPEDVNITYQWIKDDVNIDLATNRTYTADASGDYKVLVSNTATLCSATTETATTVSVIAGATAPTAANVDRNNFCSDDNGNIVLSVTGGSGSTLVWATDDAFTNQVGTGNNLSIASPTVTSIYYARWETASCGNSSSVNIIVTVSQPSVAGTASGTTSICTGTGAAISLAAYTGTIQWQSSTNNIDFDDINLANAANYNTGNLTQTTYYRALVTNGACSSIPSNTITVTVNPIVTPAVSIAITSGANPTCSGSSVTFTATPTNGGSTPSYLWKVNGNDAGLGTSYTYTPNNNDVVYAIMTTSLDCVTGATANSTSITMNTITSPTAPTSINTTDNSFCSGTAGNMTLTAVGGVGTTLRWATDALFANSIGTGVSLVIAKPTITTTYYARWETVSCGNSDAISTVITVNPLPTVYNVSGGGQYCSGGTGVTISLSSSTTGVNYTLVKDGTPTATVISGVTGSGINFNNVTVAGTYTITAQNANTCSSTMNGNAIVTVSPLPAIGTIATAQSRCASGNVTFTSGTASENGVIDWSLDNFTSVAQAASNTFTTNVNVGTPITAYYRARNTVTGCTSAISQVVGTANALPTVPTITGNASIAQGQSLTLTAEAGYTSYSWSVDGGTITNGNNTNEITLNWAAIGTKSVTVTVTNASTCTATSLIKSILVTDACVAATITTQPNSTSVCQGSTATFTVVANGTNLTYAWYRVGSPTNTLVGSAATLSLSNAQTNGTYYVVIDNGCTTDPGVQSNNVALTVTSPSTPTVSIVSNDADNSICPNTSVTFTATANNLGGGTVAYQWKLNGNNTGNNQNTYTTAALVNADQVTCTITVSNGCVTSATANSTAITTTVLPVTSITVQPQPVTVAVGSNATFNVTASGTGLTYAWYKSGDVTVLSTTNSLTVTNVQAADNANEYYCVVTGTCGNITSNYAMLSIVLPASQLVITNNITSKESGIPFNVTVETRNSNGVATNVTSATPITFTLQTGTGTITGSGTIASGANQATISITYTYINGQMGAVLSANATGLTSGLSNSFNLLPAEPAAPALTSASLTRNTATINWTSSSAVMIFAISGSTDIVTPIVSEDNMDGNNATFTASSVFSTATNGQGTPVVINPTAKLLYIGTGSTITITGLTRTTNYVFAIYSYNGTTGTWNFNPNQVQFTSRTSSKDIIEDEDGLITGKFEICKVNPNPAKDVINFCIDAFEDGNYTIELYNISGDEVISQSQLLTKGNHSMTLDLFTQKGGISAGTYFLRVRSGDETLTQQVVIMP